jgi:hypothetical protein
VVISIRKVGMNRAQRRASKSKKGGQYRGLKRPTDNGILNGKRRGK